MQDLEVIKSHLPGIYFSFPAEWVNQRTSIDKVKIAHRDNLYFPKHVSNKDIKINKCTQKKAQETVFYLVPKCFWPWFVLISTLLIPKTKQ